MKTSRCAVMRSAKYRSKDQTYLRATGECQKLRKTSRQMDTSIQRIRACWTMQDISQLSAERKHDHYQGRNVYPKEIELLLDEQPGIQESAVFGVSHADFGGVVAAIVETRRGSLTDGRLYSLSDLNSRGSKSLKH